MLPFMDIKQVCILSSMFNTFSETSHIMSVNDVKSWVLVSSIKQDTNPQDLQRISPQISILLDEWHANGKIMLSGPFDNELSSMAVFEATEQEARAFYKRYQEICSDVLTYELYQWDAMPILSILSK